MLYFGFIQVHFCEKNRTFFKHVVRSALSRFQVRNVAPYKKKKNHRRIFKIEAFSCEHPVIYTVKYVNSMYIYGYANHGITKSRRILYHLAQDTSKKLLLSYDVPYRLCVYIYYDLLLLLLLFFSGVHIILLLFFSCTTMNTISRCHVTIIITPSVLTLLLIRNFTTTIRYYIIVFIIIVIIMSHATQNLFSLFEPSSMCSCDGRRFFKRNKK